ncbi:hypothetical protein ADUPG1_001175, partial [Aduncisulcus paluster]
DELCRRAFSIYSKLLPDAHPKFITARRRCKFNSSCNLRCKWCALDHGKERKIMPREVLERSCRSWAQGCLRICGVSTCIMAVKPFCIPIYRGCFPNHRSLDQRHAAYS